MTDEISGGYYNKQINTELDDSYNRISTKLNELKFGYYNIYWSLEMIKYVRLLVSRLKSLSKVERLDFIREAEVGDPMVCLSLDDIEDIIEAVDTKNDELDDCFSSIASKRYDSNFLEDEYVEYGEGQNLEFIFPEYKQTIHRFKSKMIKQMIDLVQQYKKSM